MTEEQEKDADRIQELLQTSAAQLGEHFDSVQIIATKQYSESDEHVRFSSRSGPFYSCYGSVKEWIICKEEDWRINRQRNEGD